MDIEFTRTSASIRHIPPVWKHAREDQSLWGHAETLLKTERAPTVSSRKPPASLLFQFFAPSAFKLISFTLPSLWQRQAKVDKPVSSAVSPRRWPPVVLPARQDAAHAQGTGARPGGGPQDARASTQGQATLDSHSRLGMLLGGSTSPANRTAAPPAVSQSGLLLSYIFFSLTFL